MLPLRVGGVGSEPLSPTSRADEIVARAGHVYLARAQRADRVWFPEIVDTNTALVVVTGTTSANAPDCSWAPMGSKANGESHAP